MTIQVKTINVLLVNHDGEVARAVLDAFKARGFTDTAITVDRTTDTQGYETIRTHPAKYLAVIATPNTARDIGFLCQCLDNARVSHPPVISYGHGSTLEAEQNGAIPSYDAGHLRATLHDIAEKYRPPKTEAEILEEIYSHKKRPVQVTLPPEGPITKTYKINSQMPPKIYDGGTD